MEEKTLTNIYNAIDDIILIVNDDFSIESINRKGKEVFQINEEQLRKNKCYELICKKEKQENNCPLLCINRNSIPSKEIILERKGRTYKGISKQINQNNNQSVQFLDVFHDVTDFIEKEKDQKVIRDEYEALNEEYLSSIEELKEKNKIILEEKQKFEQLFTNMNSAFALHEIILDNNGQPIDYRFLECNPMFEKQTGLKASEIKNKTTLEVLPNLERFWIETYGKVALEGKPISFTNYTKELDKYYETFCYSPKKGFFAVIFDDVTAQKAEEEELKRVTTKALENEAKFKAAFMTSPDAVNINTLDGTYIEINEGFTALTGYTRKDVIGLKSSEIDIWTIPEDRIKLVDTLKNDGEIENLESLFRCKDASLRAGLMSAKIIKINNEPHILSITRDISDKKLNEQKLKVENTIAEAFATADNSIVFQHVLDTLLEFFECEYGLFGYIDDNGNLACPSLTFKIWDKCQIPDKDIVFLKENWNGVWGESLIKKKSIIKNKDLHVPEGHIQLHNSLAVVITDKSDLVGQIVLGNKNRNFSNKDKTMLEEFCLYISPLLKAYLKEINYKKEIIEAKEKAEKADRLKSAFLANMSHEIRTPLNGIMGFTELLTEQKNLTEEQKYRYASVITKSSESLIQIVNDILDISSLESGNFNLYPKPFELKNCLSELYNLFSKKLADSKNINLIQKNSFGKLLIHNDENRLRQIFSNLLDNAIKFTELGNIQFGISDIEEKRIVFFVSDTGIGIPEDKHSIIFNRFRQGEETSTRVYGGNGLGLSIVKELIQLMGGKIWLTSILGKGTTFYFTLPLTKPTGFNERKEESEHYISSKKIKVLVVEDDEFNAQYLEEIMKNIETKCIVCKNGLSAVEKVKSDNYDIILLDIQLPDINGFEVAKEIRKFNQKIPIIAQTAYAFQSDEEKAISSGCNDYVSKPISKKVLLEKINRLFK